MLLQRKRSIAMMITVFAALLLLPATALAAPTLQVGSQNGDVWDLQYRLQILGYYKGDLDGRFGGKTYEAVRQFQRDYGLAVDGVAGPRTWQVLKKVSVNQDEMQMMAQLIHGEARGEIYEGQVAVAAVVLNRLQSDLFPDTIKGVIFEPNAFTAIEDGQYWLKPDKTAYKAVWDAVRGWDPSGDALYYFNPDTATSAWIWSRPQIKKIGNHIFAK